MSIFSYEIDLHNWHALLLASVSAGIFCSFKYLNGTMQKEQKSIGISYIFPRRKER